MPGGPSRVDEEPSLIPLARASLQRAASSLQAARPWPLFLDGPQWRWQPLPEGKRLSGSQAASHAGIWASSGRDLSSGAASSLRRPQPTDVWALGWGPGTEVPHNPNEMPPPAKQQFAGFDPSEGGQSLARPRFTSAVRDPDAMDTSERRHRFSRALKRALASGPSCQEDCSRVDTDDIEDRTTATARESMHVPFTEPKSTRERRGSLTNLLRRAWRQHRSIGPQLDKPDLLQEASRRGVLGAAAAGARKRASGPLPSTTQDVETGWAWGGVLRMQYAHPGFVKV